MRGFMGCGGEGFWEAFVNLLPANESRLRGLPKSGNSRVALAVESDGEAVV